MDWLVKIAGAVNPLLGGAIAAVNAVMGDGDQLPPDADPASVQAAYERLPADKRAQVDQRMAHELAMQQDNTVRITSLAQSDAASGAASTRPHIALVSCYAVLTVTVGQFVLALVPGAEPLEWPVVASMVAVPGGWVTHYIGARTKEKIQNVTAATGAPQLLSGVTGLISAFRR